MRLEKKLLERMTDFFEESYILTGLKPGPGMYVYRIGTSNKGPLYACAVGAGSMRIGGDNQARFFSNVLDYLCTLPPCRHTYEWWSGFVWGVIHGFDAYYQSHETEEKILARRGKVSKKTRLECYRGVFNARTHGMIVGVRVAARMAKAVPHEGTA